jgi:hypothetical protein
LLEQERGILDALAAYDDIDLVIPPGDVEETAHARNA